MDAEHLGADRLSDAQRIEIICELLAEVVPGIRAIQGALTESEDQSNLVSLAVAALGRLGWIAEQSCVIAGYALAPVVGPADAWLLGGNSVLSELRDVTGTSSQWNGAPGVHRTNRPGAR